MVINIQHTSCAFTGHRPNKFPWKYNEFDSRCMALKRRLVEQVTALAQSGVTDYYSGMADGSDIWLSQIVLDLRKENPTLKLNCVLPCENQTAKWSDKAKKRWQAILDEADSVTYVSHQYYDGCMLKRNRRLVDSAGILLAVCSNTQRSGTAATINYARKAGRQIITIHPITLHTTYEGFESDAAQP